MLIDQAIRFALIRRNLPSPPCRLLDVGCGSGNLAEFLAREGYSVDACDRSPHSPFGNRDAGVRYFQADGAKLQVPDQAYDCTISCDVLEHVVPADRDAFIAEMFRVTKDGGKVVFTVFLRNTLSFRLWGQCRCCSTASCRSGTSST